MCEVLEEMRKAYETRNFSYLPGLIEEAQVMVSRMEAGLRDKEDLRELNEDRSKLKAEVKKLKTEVTDLEVKKKFLIEAKGK